MRPVGFSTGALYPGDVAKAIKLLNKTSATALEVSLLKVRELEGIEDVLDDADLSQFQYLSFHAPIDCTPENVEAVADRLSDLTAVYHEFAHVVVHPGLLAQTWLSRSHVILENMDARTPEYSTWGGLRDFERANPGRKNTEGYCIDLAHAMNADPQGYVWQHLLREGGTQIREFHVSALSEVGKHIRLPARAPSFGSLRYLHMQIVRAWSHFIRTPLAAHFNQVPLIIESPLCDLDRHPDEVETEMYYAKRLLPWLEEE